MKKFNHILIALIALSVSSCYESYEKDFDVTRAYFASQRPLRTLVADTGMSIKVGVAIGGKREVDPPTGPPLKSILRFSKGRPLR